MGSGGLQFDSADVLGAARLNQKTLFVGTGAQINGLATTYAGQMAYCTTSGNGFTIDTFYQRNGANTGWFVKGFPWLGNGSDGSPTIAGNTDLGSSNNKNYVSLTINNGITLTANNGFTVRVMQTLTFGNASSQILVDGKGAAGGSSVAGNGGGTLKVVCYAISGTGLITANGANGTFNAGVTTAASGSVAQVYNNNATGSGGGGTGLGGGGGGAFAGSGGGGENTNVGGTAISITTITTLYTFLTQFGTFGAGGGGSNNGVGGGGAGGLALLYCETAIPALTMQALGGNGTNDGATHKSGGGGGGICIAMTRSTDSSTKTVTGGTGGGAAAANGTAGSTVSIPL